MPDQPTMTREEAIRSLAENIRRLDDAIAKDREFLARTAGQKAVVTNPNLRRLVEGPWRQVTDQMCQLRSVLQDAITRLSS